MTTLRLNPQNFPPSSNTLLTPGSCFQESSGPSNLVSLQGIALASTPVDMRAGMDTLMAKAIQQFGQVIPHLAYLFTNRSHNRLKLIVHDGFGLWLCSRRLHKGSFKWNESEAGNQLLSQEQLSALLLGLPWQGLGEASIYRYA